MLLSLRNRTWVRIQGVIISLCLLGCAPGLRAEDMPEEWTYRRLLKPTIPTVHRQDWVKNPIDAFILAELEKHALQPSACTDRLTLLKRVTFDLTGLAPTPEDCDAFLKDTSDDAYDKVVDRLLASTQFGERWAQHWLDVVRYSETEGYKVDRTRPNAFRYRDYVIQAFNSDLPYNRFVQQQLAGDELEPKNPSAVVATGFLRIHPEESNGSNYRLIRQDILDDITEVSGLTFMGLTIGCARCHDHKFDPLTQEDFYRFQAFFTPLMPTDQQSLLSGAAGKTYDERMQSWLKVTESYRQEMDQMLKPIGKDVFKEIVETLDPDTQEALNREPDQRNPMQKQLALLGGKQIEKRFTRMHRRLTPDQRAHYEDLQKKIADYDSIKPDAPKAMAVTDVGPLSPPTYRLGGGDYRRPKEEVQPGFPERLDTSPPQIQPLSKKSQSTGRRTALARWLTEPNHPLSSRVIVNRLWAQYFGQGIVGTPNDFGKMGIAPTHPELLDFLASELVEREWSLKAIHKLMVTSATYRQASIPEQNPLHTTALQSDPSNRFLWHMRVRRRDAESLRDTALQVSGLMNRRMFGPGALPELPPQVSENRYAWSPDTQESDRNRRSVYVYHSRNLLLPILQVFDAPNRNNSCPTRSNTVSAPQALTILNGEFMLKQARHLAGRILQPSVSTETLVRRAYREILQRSPSAEELSHGKRFLQEQAQRITQGPPPTTGSLPDVDLPAGMTLSMAAALVDLSHGLMSCAEFLYVE